MSQLRAALNALLTACDGARSLDGHGFNGYDAPFAKDIAAKQSWTPKMERAVWKMLRKYRGQLSGFGIDYEMIPEPPDPSGPLGAVQRENDPTPRSAVSIERGPANGFLVRFPYSPETVELMRQVPGRTWVKEMKHWHVDGTKPEAVRGLIRFAEQTNATLPAGMVEEIKSAEETLRKQEAENAVRIEQSIAVDADFEVPGLGGELMPFQRAGVKYAVDAKRCLIADEMGLGKTVQALATVFYLDAFPCVVVVPASVKLNWVREGRKWLPGVTVDLFERNKFCSVTVVNYDQLGKWKDAILSRKPKAVVFDECHYLKNHKAQRSQHAAEIAKEREVVLCLTGTPILNRPGELFNQLTIMGRVKDVGGFQHFRKHFLGYDWKGSGKNIEELQKLARSKFLIRREKADVLKDLPSKRRVKVELEMEDPASYNALDMMDLDDSPAAALVRIGELRREVARQKLEATKEWVGSFLEGGKKLVLFATHREIQASLIDAFPGCTSILGEHDPKQRQEAVDKFQEDPDCKLIVCSLKAAGVGLTLTAASDVAFVERGWTPGDMDQAEDRTHRIGQAESVTAWYLTATGTIDDDMDALIDSKRATAMKLLNVETMGKDENTAKDELVKKLLARYRDAGRLKEKVEA